MKVIYLKSILSLGVSPLEHEITMWRAVIYQALSDLVYEGGADKNRKRDAEKWFFKPNKDFQLVCDLAHMVPSILRKRAREIKANPSLLRQM